MKIKQRIGGDNSLNYLSLKIVTIMIMLLMIGFGHVYSETNSSQQNQLTVSGIITDNNGDPLPGVSVVVSSTVGTATDFNGRYSVPVPANGSFTVTYLGYKKQVIQVNNRSSINITMEEDTQLIDEVVVVGYGTQRKVTLTGAVSSIKGDKLITVKNENVQNMLTGKIPGVRVWQRTAEPGAFDTRFDIRGLGTPLIIIDGVPRSMEEFQRLSAVDIEDISVLKDGASAIYGVRAANGVVLISTKRGTTTGKIEVSYTGSYILQYPSGLPDVVDVFEYMKIRNWNRQNNSAGIQIPEYSEADYNDFKEGKRTAWDWNAYMLNDHTPETLHNLSIRGGNDRTNYYFGVGYFYQNSFFRGNDRNYNKYTLTSSISSKIFDNLAFNFALSSIIDERNQPDESAVWTIRDYWRMNPIVGPLTDGPEQKLNQAVFETENPYSMTFSDAIGSQKRNRKYIDGQASIKWDIPGVKGLSLKGLIGYNYNFENYRQFRKKCFQYTYNATTGVYQEGVASRYNINRFRHEQFLKEQMITQSILDYNGKFDLNSIAATLIWESQWRKGDNLYAQRDLAFPRGTLAAGVAANQEGNMNTGSGSYYNRNNNALAGRLNYAYADKYLAEFLFRYDGSSNFAPGYQWGFFPGGSVAWRIAEESFIKESSLSFIQQLKLRSSYAITGDDTSGQYQFMTGYTYPVGNDSRNFSSGYVFNGSWVGSVQNRGIPNPYITWFKTKMFNVAVDFDAWNGLFGFTLDFFNRDIEGLLERRTGGIPTVVGADLPQENLNGRRHRGLELELRHRNRIGDVNYNLSAWGSITRNQRLYWEERTFNSSRDRWINSRAYRYDGIYRPQSAGTYQYIGQFQSWEEIWNWPLFTGANTIPGNYKYLDWNGDGEFNGQDAHPIHFSDTPWMNFSLNSEVAYKKFDLTLQLQGSAMGSLKYGEQLRGESTTLRAMLDRWHTVEPMADPFDPQTQWVKGTYALNPRAEDDSSFNIDPIDYLRLKNVELGYTIDKIKGVNLRLFVGGNNVFTLTKVRNVDPEHPPADDSWGFMYPLNKTLTLGLTLKF